jgi:hypothetical protein
MTDTPDYAAAAADADAADAVRAAYADARAAYAARAADNS